MDYKKNSVKVENSVINLKWALNFKPTHISKPGFELERKLESINSCSFVTSGYYDDL